MPVDTNLARNQYLAAVATIVARAKGADPDATRSAARDVAADVAQQFPGVDAGDLYDSLPQAWREKPGGSEARGIAEAS